ncbi:13579_t:CDS:2, partial [Gigaspora margarita]
EKINQFDKQEEEIEQYNKQIKKQKLSAQYLYKTTIYQPPKFLHPAYAQYMEIVMN